MGRHDPLDSDISLERIADALDKIEETLTKIEENIERWMKPSMTINYSGLGDN